MESGKRLPGLFTFLPCRPLLVLRPQRKHPIPSYNEPSIAMWYSMEQLEARGLQEGSLVNHLEDWARPWRTGWHPPLTGVAAGRPVDARRNAPEECPSYHRNRAGYHPVIRFDGIQQYMELTPYGTIHQCFSGNLQHNSFTLFLVVSCACLEGAAPWPILSAKDSESRFGITIAADLRMGSPCYVLSFGAGGTLSCFFSFEKQQQVYSGRTLML